VGAVVVLGGALVVGAPLRVARCRWGGLAALSLLFTVQIGLLNIGTQYTLAARATVLTCTYPVFVALFAHYLLRGDRLTVTRTAGLALALGGVALVFWDALFLLDRRYLLGDLLTLGSGVLLGLRQVVLKRLVADLHPYTVLFWQAALSLPVFTLAAVAAEGAGPWSMTGPVIGAVAYMGVVLAGFCFMVNVSLMRRYQASVLGAFGFATPVFGVLLSGVLLGEPLSPVLLLSMALVGLGIAVVSWERR